MKKSIKGENLKENTIFNLFFVSQIKYSFFISER
jgi:hypothetical protein